MTVKLKLYDLYTTVSGLSIQDSKKLADHMTYLSPNATPYNPRYASGAWNGLECLYDRLNSRFPTGLLYTAQGFFKREGIDVEIDASILASRSVQEVDRPYSPKFPLREYQQKATASALRWKRGLIAIPTGGGKTEVAQALIKDTKASKIVFLVPTTALLSQTAKRMKAAFPDTEVIKWGAGAKPPEQCLENYILVATVASAFRVSHPLLEEAEAVFLDEAHHLAAETFKQAIQFCGKARFRIGLSGTTYRSDGLDMELEAWLGPIVFQISYEELIQMGVLVPPVFKTVKDLEEGLKLCQGRKTLIFSEKAEPLFANKELFAKYNIPILTSKVKQSERQGYLDRLDDGTIAGIAATPLLDEGVDVPNIDCIFFFATDGSRTKVVQRIGRGLRAAEGKTDCLVIDLVDKMYSNRVMAYFKEPAFASRLN